ncbi:hypothetical protein [Rhizobium giardinii]|uniref:Starch synthase n=1 Tax=Rhizobium giardinii TaxID=56731 RepID=A0A7W8UEB9_9HYPH|nr:hypothetical protein [Rhizobium giardinii]MBB5537809.1 starch synthase [Rhizobium giardinii]
MKIGYEERIAHLLHGGADAMLVPSGSGGLSETVIDANDAALHARAATGIQFSPIDADGLRQPSGALSRCFATIMPLTNCGGRQ